MWTKLPLPSRIVVDIGILRNSHNLHAQSLKERASMLPIRHISVHKPRLPRPVGPQLVQARAFQKKPAKEIFVLAETKTDKN